MVDQVVANDAWLVQAVGGKKEYGNGTNGLITIGPAPPVTLGNPDYKGRGVFEVDLTSALSGATGITSGIFEATVGPNTCIGSRGGTIRILLQELTADFNNKSAPSDCEFSSGNAGNAGVWGVSDNINTANQALHSSGAHVTGDKLQWNIAALLGRKLSEPGWDYILRFRLVACNSAGTALDEANQARRITIYSVRDGTAGNRPKVTVVPDTSSSSKTVTDNFSFLEASRNITRTGTGTVDVSDSFSFSESSSVINGVLWTTVDDPSSDSGVAQLIIPGTNQASHAFLTAAVEDDQVDQFKFKINKLPVGGNLIVRLLARVQGGGDSYRVDLLIRPDSSALLAIAKNAGGVSSNLATVDNVITVIAGQYYYLKLQLTGFSPTTIAAKSWSEQAVEPGWQLVVQDSEASLQTTGYVGMGAHVYLSVTNNPITFKFDDFAGISL